MTLDELYWQVDDLLTTDVRAALALTAVLVGHAHVSLFVGDDFDFTLSDYVAAFEGNLLWADATAEWGEGTVELTLTPSEKDRP
jgi:hypothetical protein